MSHAPHGGKLRAACCRDAAVTADGSFGDPSDEYEMQSRFSRDAATPSASARGAAPRRLARRAARRASRHAARKGCRRRRRRQRNMVREFSVKLACPLSAEAFWALRSDTGFDEYFAKLDKQDFTLIENDLTEDADGEPYLKRKLKLALHDNPVPASVQRMTGIASDGFAFRVRSSFHPNKYDEAHPYTYQTIFPVLTEKITVMGLQWCVPLGEEACELHGAIKVSVAMPGLGGTAERAIEKSMKAAYVGGHSLRSSARWYRAARRGFRRRPAGPFHRYKTLPGRAIDYIKYRDEMASERAKSERAAAAAAADGDGSEPGEGLAEELAAAAAAAASHSANPAAPNGTAGTGGAGPAGAYATVGMAGGAAVPSSPPLVAMAGATASTSASAAAAEEEEEEGREPPVLGGLLEAVARCAAPNLVAKADKSRHLSADCAKLSAQCAKLKAELLRSSSETTAAERRVASAEGESSRLGEELRAAAASLKAAGEERTALGHQLAREISAREAAEKAKANAEKAKAAADKAKAAVEAAAASAAEQARARAAAATAAEAARERAREKTAATAAATAAAAAASAARAVSVVHGGHFLITTAGTSTSSFGEVGSWRRVLFGAGRP